MITERKIEKQEPKPAFRVFISSTYMDMIPYRDAVQTALNRADCIAYGMERFGARAIPPLEACYKELEDSQIYICVLGMRYGTVDESTGKSYTQLEYEKARELGKPTLVFLIDESKVKFNLSEIDMGMPGEKLASFKKTIKDTKEVTCDFFDSAMALQETIGRSIDIEIRRQGIIEPPVLIEEEEYIFGANKYRDFVRRPERYKDHLITLQVRMDGKYGGWKLRDEIAIAFGLPKGDLLYLNDLWVLGLDKIDVDDEVWQIDCMAVGQAADWLDRNKVTQGTVFEGKFKTAYKRVPQIAGRGLGEQVDAMVAKLILVEGLRVIGTDTQVRRIDNELLNMFERIIKSSQKDGQLDIDDLQISD